VVQPIIREVNKTKYGETVKAIFEKREAIDNLYDEVTRIEETITAIKNNAFDAITNERASIKERLGHLKLIQKTIKKA